MSRYFKRIFAIVLIMLFTAVTPIQTLNNSIVFQVEAHSGRTDAYGGHRDNKNRSGLGSYHYHCDGHPPHLHKNGECPYSYSYTNESSKSNKSTKSSKSNSTVKKVQKALNKLGYDCGKADGISGKKTVAALKEFQRDNDLKVDGKIGKQVKTALNIK